MITKGTIVDLSSLSYETPNCCASCLGPRQTDVKAWTMERFGNVSRIRTMTFPYCDPCAKRARREKIRALVVELLAAAAGIGLAFVAWHAHVAIAAPLRFTVALLLAMAIGALLAWVTRPSVPAAPATARGEAVILKGTGGAVLCTNPRYAELLAKANLRTTKPGTHRLTPELVSPVLALLAGVFVLCLWFKASLATSTHPSPASTHAPAAAATKKH